MAALPLHAAQATATLAALMMSTAAHAEGTKTTDTYHPKEKASVVCSLAVDPGRSFDDREASYKECVHDHMGPEYDAEMNKTIKRQRGYENLKAEADQKGIPLDQKSMWIRVQMKARGYE